LAALPVRGSERVGYIGAGLSPGEEYYDEPYFYISVDPKPEPTTLPKLSPIGHWHTHEFTAAIAPAHKILAAREQEVDTRKFLHNAFAAALQLLC
jgi:hypothetical protein